MASLPSLRSFNQILGDMIDGFLSRYGLRAFRVGSPLLSIFESASEGGERDSGDTLQGLNATTLDGAEDDALDRIGRDENLPRIQEAPAVGDVTIRDTSFNRLATRIFAGKPAPIAGSTTIYLSDATGWTPTGRTYIGRGLDSLEGPLVYTSLVFSGSYWTMMLASGTLRFHNNGEEVVLGQGGDRGVVAGSIVQTPQGNVSDAIQFSTLFGITIPDGEVEVQGVSVIARGPGVIGNVAAESIRGFDSPPSTGLVASNPRPFTTGLPREGDVEYRERIRQARASRARGTPLALKTFVIGIVAPDEGRRVLSASVVQRLGLPATLYVDDGTGYEPVSEGVAFESMVDSALGGEQYFKLAARPPVTKAYLESLIDAPFSVRGGHRLALRVGGVITEHAFADSDFRAPGVDSAFEIVASINSDFNLLWSARTIRGGRSFIVFAKSDTNEDIEVVEASENDANDRLVLPDGRRLTLWLYRNDRLLTKDGLSATLVGRPFARWGTLLGPQTLTIAVDGTPAFTYTITDADFVAAGTGYTAVGQNSPEAWAAVLDSRIPGTTSFKTQGALGIASNLGARARARLEILGGSLVSAGLLPAALALGADRDYTLDRSRGEIALSRPLQVGERLTAGSIWTRAFIESPVLVPTTLASDAALWLSIDSNARLVNTGIGAGTLLSVSANVATAWGHRLRLLGTSGLFGQLAPGDYEVVWDSALPAALRRNVLRVSAVDPAGAYFESGVPAIPFSTMGAQSVVLPDGRVLVCGGYASWGPFATSYCAAYDPATGAWSSLATMIHPRALHTATLTASGKVFVFGGVSSSQPNTVEATGEVYDPGADTWTAASTTGAPGARYGHAAVELVSGLILICGGRDLTSTLASCFTYDDVGDTWAAAAMLATPRALHTISRLPDDTILAVGGEQDFATALATTELADAAVVAWAPAGTIQFAREGHAAVVRADGKLMVAGGSVNGSGTPLIPVSPTLSSLVDVYNPMTGTWAPGPGMTSARAYFRMDLLDNGDVVAAFGQTILVMVEKFTGGAWANVAPPTFDQPRAFVVGGRVGVNQMVYAGGGSLQFFNPKVYGSSEVLDEAANTWSQPTPFSTTTVALVSGGLEASRASAPPFELIIPAGASYTAPSFVNALHLPANLDGGDRGATAKTYRTTRVRLSTNTRLTPGGDLAVVGEEPLAASFGLLPSDAIENITGHLASVASQRRQDGTPEFRQVSVRGSLSPVLPLLHRSGTGTTDLPSSGDLLVGLEPPADSFDDRRYSTNYMRWWPILGRAWDENLVQVEQREPVEGGWTPYDRAFFAHAFAIGPEDDLGVVLDQNPISRRYQSNGYRRLRPNSAVYGLQNGFQDLDQSPTGSLAAAFGLAFLFDDYAVYMRSRVKTDAADVTRRVVWRWFRFGADGDNARLRYSLPPTANLPVTVLVDPLAADRTNVSVQLAGGAPRLGTSLRPTTRIGVCVQNPGGGLQNVSIVAGFEVSAASRTTNVTILTLTLPGPVTDHGLQVGDSIYLRSTDANFPTGLYSLTGVTLTTVTYSEMAADATGMNIGSLSSDTAEALLGVISVGDFLRVATSSGLPSQIEEQTTRLTAASTRFAQGRMENVVVSYGTVLTWYSLVDAAAISIFQNPAQTTSQVVAAVNALHAAANSSCPIFGTVVGSGAGVQDRSSAERDAVSPAWTDFSDGLNWVKTTVPPPIVAQDYELVFKDPINPILAGPDSDWANEEVRVSPVLSRSIVRWLRSAAVTGLGAVADVETSDMGRRVQLSSRSPGTGGSVEVQAGTMSRASSPVAGAGAVASTRLVVPVRRPSRGLVGRGWVSLDNAAQTTKLALGATAKLLSWSATGEMIFDAGGAKVWDFSAVSSPFLGVAAAVEKQGEFVCLTDYGLAASMLAVGAQEGDWVRLVTPAFPIMGRPALSSVNLGIFRIVRIISPGLDGYGGSVWIENPEALEELGSADVSFIEYDSLMPGDTLLVSTPLWGIDNVGPWKILSVGEVAGVPFTNQWRMRVDTATRTPVAVSPGVALGADAALVQVLSAKPSRLIKRLLGVSPNQQDPSLLDLKLDSAVAAREVGESLGTVITALDKLDFPLGVALGADGYRHTVGLIGEANRVAYGDEQDPATYPGIVAADAHVNIDSPNVRRVLISVLVRLKTNVPPSAVEDRIRSAIAASINASGSGESASISGYVAAAERVAGVEAITPLAPALSTGSDLIVAQPFEELRVLDPEADISVSFVG